MNNLAKKHSVTDFLPILRRCYLESVPYGGVLESDIPPQRLPLYQQMVDDGLLFITERPGDELVFCITRKGAILLSPRDLHECVNVTSLQWLALKQDTNIRPIFHGPFFSRVK